MTIVVIISIIAVIVTFIGIVITVVLHVHNVKRDRAKIFEVKCESFRSAFSIAVAELDACRHNIHAIMSPAIVNHNAAIVEFRKHLRRSNQAAFDAAENNFRRLRNSNIDEYRRLKSQRRQAGNKTLVNNLRRLYDPNEPAISQHYHAQATGDQPWDHRTACTELLKAINEMLKFAEPA
jgi:hypothetical protein